MMELTSAQEAEIRHLAEQTYPHECCGLLVGRVNQDSRRIVAAVAAENKRTDSLHNRYLIDPDWFQKTERKLRGGDKEIVGFFHSHPDAPARPSEFDREHAWPWYSYLIVSVVKGAARELTGWRLREDRSGFEPEEIRSCTILET